MSVCAKAHFYWLIPGKLSPVALKPLFSYGVKCVVFPPLLYVGGQIVTGEWLEKGQGRLFKATGGTAVKKKRNGARV